MNAASTPPDNTPQTIHAAAFEARVEAILPTLATKADLADLRTELRIEIKDLQLSVMAEIAKLRDELRDELSKLRTEQAKLFRQVLMWVIATVIAQFIGLSSVMFAAANIIAASQRSAPAHAALPVKSLVPPTRIELVSHA